MADLTKKQLLEMYHQMVLIRRFEERALELYHQHKIGGVYLHLYNGEEGTGVGAINALRPQDHVITSYRDHGAALVKGVEPRRVMAELFGKTTGVSGGKGGSMHIADRAHNFWGGYAIVGGHLPLAAGIALKAKYNGDDEVVLCLLGDGATNNGYFHESLNMSAVWNLPVIWMIENNLYGMGTASEVASGQPELVKRAIAYGMKQGPRIDGQNVLSVHDATSEAVEYARKHGPILLESMTYRYEGHGVSDKMFVNRTEELQHYKERDPIIVLRDYLLEQFEDIGPELEAAENLAVDIVEESVKFAEQSPDPDYSDLVRNIYA